MRSAKCRVCLHLDIEEIDRRLLAGEKPGVIAAWLMNRRPGAALNRFQIGKHRNWHLQPERVQPPPPPPPEPILPPPPAPKPSSLLGRDVTEDDIEQAMLKKFLDSIDSIPAEKVAELMIEREKARQRGMRAPAKGKGDEPPADGDPIAHLKRSIGDAVGARPTRTGVRMRAMKGGRTG